MSGSLVKGPLRGRLILVILLSWAITLSGIASPVAAQSETPRARGYHALAYDSRSDRVVLFAGIIADSTIPEGYRPVADTWALDVASNEWTRLVPSSHPWMSATDIGRDDELVGFFSLAYDAESDAVVGFRSLVDNHDDPTPFANAPANDTWALPGGQERWIRMGTGSGPAPSAGRFGPRMAYDSQSDRIIFYGGDPGPNETWAYDFNTNTWERMSPPVSPPRRAFHRLVYDLYADRIIMFGGFPNGGALNDTWAYDYEADTWTPLSPSSAPSRRGYHGMAYDETSRVVVLFGGVAAPVETVNAETWVFDLSTNEWTQRSPARSPSARGWHDMVYVPSLERVVLFSGGETRYTPLKETWTYDVANDTWVQLDGEGAPSGEIPWLFIAAAGVVIAAVATVSILLLRRRTRG